MSETQNIRGKVSIIAFAFKVFNIQKVLFENFVQNSLPLIEPIKKKFLPTRLASSSIIVFYLTLLYGRSSWIFIFQQCTRAPRSFHLRGISSQHLLVSGRPKQFSAKIEKPFWYQFQYRPKQRNEFGIDQKEKIVKAQ